jgi:protein SCO1
MIRGLFAGALLALGLAAPAQAQSRAPLPFDLGGPFALTDQYGNPRSQIDPDGWAQLLYFGYANCPGVCTMALPAIADAADALAGRDIAVRPVMITVDPKRDTVTNMGEAMARLHPDFLGLTGGIAALDQAYRAFSVENAIAFTDPEKGDIFTHGTFIYLLDGQGRVLTILPPVLSGARIASIAETYLMPKD